MYVVLFLLSTSTLRHPNLVALVGVVDDLPTPFIELTLVLSHYLTIKALRVSLNRCIDIFYACSLNTNALYQYF